MKVINFKLIEKLYDALKEAAKRKNIPLASLIRLACSEWLERESKNQ
jgi:predicted DNA-binding ribbon-helix-helix protein